MAFGDQGALFEKTAPWTPTKTFIKIEGFDTLFICKFQ
jgi:hypothetical protein